MLTFARQNNIALAYIVVQMELKRAAIAKKADRTAYDVQYSYRT